MKSTIIRRIIATLLLTVLCMGIASAESALNFVKDQGYKITKAGKSKKTLIADYDESSAGCVITFSNKTNKYSVTLEAGQQSVARQLYTDILSLEEWDTAAYSVDGKALAVFNRPDVSAKNTSDTIADYATYISKTFKTVAGATPTPAPTVKATKKPETAKKSSGRTYVLNTNTKKFHYPGCYSEKKIKQENRQEYTGTREEIIAMGYDPCGNCNP